MFHSKLQSLWHGHAQHNRHKKLNCGRGKWSFGSSMRRICVTTDYTIHLAFRESMCVVYALRARACVCVFVCVMLDSLSCWPHCQFLHKKFITCKLGSYRQRAESNLLYVLQILINCTTTTTTTKTTTTTTITTTTTTKTTTQIDNTLDSTGDKIVGSQMKNQTITVSKKFVFSLKEY